MIIGMAYEAQKEEIVKSQRYTLYTGLEQMLLLIAGRELVYQESSWLELIIIRGTVMTELVKLKKGQPSQCFENVLALAGSKPQQYHVAFGCGLSDDGLWRFHSWVVDIKKELILETTVSRVIYFGFAVPIALLETGSERSDFHTMTKEEIIALYEQEGCIDIPQSERDLHTREEWLEMYLGLVAEQQQQVEKGDE